MSFRKKRSATAQFLHNFCLFITGQEKRKLNYIFQLYYVKFFHEI